MLKKIIIALAILIIFFALGVVAFVYFSQPRSEQANKETPGLIDTLKNLFPVSETKTAEPEPEPTSETSAVEESSSKSTTEMPVVGLPPAGSLRQIFSGRVAGFALLAEPRTSSSLYFVEKESGRLFRLASTTLEVKRLSQTSQARVLAAALGRDAAGLRVALLTDDQNSLKSFVGTYKTSTSSDTGGDLLFTPIAGEASNFLSSPAGDRLFYFDIIGNQTLGLVGDWDSKRRNGVFQSPYRSWLAAWPEPNTLALQTKYSAAAPGYLYFVNLKTGLASKILSVPNGLSALVSPDARQILYSSGGESVPSSLKLYTINPPGLVELNLKTMPEKCVWTLNSKSFYCAVPNRWPTGNYPDDWYQGEVTTSDQFWLIDAKTGTGKILLEPAKILGESGVDAEHLAWDDGQKLLYFINRTDESLWVANLAASF